MDRCDPSSLAAQGEGFFGLAKQRNPRPEPRARGARESKDTAQESADRRRYFAGRSSREAVFGCSAGIAAGGSASCAPRARRAPAWRRDRRAQDDAARGEADGLVEVVQRGGTHVRFFYAAIGTKNLIPFNGRGSHAQTDGQFSPIAPRRPAGTSREGNDARNLVAADTQRGACLLRVVPAARHKSCEVLRPARERAAAD